MTKRILVLSLVLVAAVTISTAIAYGADMFSGNWKLNVAKSKFSPGPGPKSNMQKIEANDGGFKLVTDGENAEGKKTHNEYTVKFDGKDYAEHPMVDGKPNPNGADMISVKKIDDYTYETTAKQKGKVTVVTKNVVSKDGKTRTATATGKNGQGQTVSNTTVWEKQ